MSVVHGMAFRVRKLLLLSIYIRLWACDGEGICHEANPQHSGYINAGGDTNYFYYLAKSRSATPDVDPLIIWLTGGPGCSSILALLTENGPCSVAGRDSNSGEWKLARNPSSWNELGNVLYIDQPVGVGYSTPGNDLLEFEWQVADRMQVFLINFYKKFPAFLQVPLFLTGESYAGHYVPAIAAHLLDYQGNGVGKLIGIAMGNALVDAVLQFKSKPEMAFTGGGGSLGGGVVSKSVYEEMKRTLPWCVDSIRNCHRSHAQSICLNAYVTCVMEQIEPVAYTGADPYDLRIGCHGTVGCLTLDEETEFLNDAKVKEQLGVPAWRKWEACNMTVVYPFIVSGDELFSYHRQVSRLLAAGVQVLVYAGDTDFMVDWIGCRAWVENLAWGHRQEWNAAPNLPFKVDNVTAGMKQTFHGLTFMQIHNAGHLVPMDQPHVSLQMIREFLAEALRTPPRPSYLISMYNHVQLTCESTFTLCVSAACMALVVLAIAAWRVAMRRRSEDSYQLMA